MSPPLLSICIPTHNRRQYLETSLTEITRQAAEFPEVEVIVINNNSTDTTEALVAKVWLKYPPIRYFRNLTNIGAERNYIRCVEEAGGEYVWIFGDDEILMVLGLSYIIKALKSNRAPHILLGNMRNTDSYINEFYPSFQQMIKQRGAQIAIEYTLITRWIFRKELFDFKIAEEKLSTRLSHSYAIRKEGKVLVLNKPVIRVRKHRPPIHDNTNADHIWLNFLDYLEYLGVPVSGRIAFLWEHTVKGAIMRNLGKCRDMVIQ
jgi:glycosyltransferase involved in cell wall biosynthesis